MSSYYWHRLLKSRISRRRALAASGALAGSAAFLAACGGSDDDGGTTAGGDSGLVADYEDSLQDAKHGGILKEYSSSEPSHLDPHFPLASLNFQARNVYGTLLVEEPGYKGPSEGAVTGDLARSWEFSPDHLKLTMKLRDGLKWHNKPPVNGRAVDVDDVLATVKRYESIGALQALMFSSKNPDAPILRIEAKDASTVVVTLAESLAYVHKYFASYGSFTGNMVMLPKEADSGFDPRRDMIGHGPWILEEHQPSVGFNFRRNPDHYDETFAFLDTLFNVPKFESEGADDRRVAAHPQEPHRLVHQNSSGAAARASG